MKKIILNDIKGRDKLAEGRNVGLGFGFLKLTKESNDEQIYNAIHPISACKDYLNEVVFSEKYKKPSSAYGFSYKPQDLFRDSNYVYLGIKIVPYRLTKNDYYSKRNIDKDKALLQKRMMLPLIREVEKALGVKRTTKIFIANEGLVVKAPIDWVKSTAAISLYTLLLRLGVFYDKKTHILDFLDKVKEGNCFEGDSSMAKGLVPRLKFLMEMKEVPGQTFKPEGVCPHNYGIFSVNPSSYFDYDQQKEKTSK